MRSLISSGMHQSCKKASDAAGYILSLDGTLELPQHRLLKEKLEEYAGRQIENPGL